jgi:KRAB domain-containing zinc finger protein
MGHMTEPQRNCAQQKTYKHLWNNSDKHLLICDVCKKRFKKPSALKLHVRVHTGERPFTCGICKISFRWLGNLKMHHRIHTGERPFMCDICKKSFRSSQSLKKHLCTLRNLSGSQLT